MARTTAEIKKTMTDAFLSDKTLREKYGLKEGTTWNAAFSAVSIENILLFVVAACCHVLEVLTEQWINETCERMDRAVVASVPWYHRTALAFQYGDSLVLDEDTGRYGYAATDEGKQPVKYVAVRDRGTSVEILASADKDGMPVPLEGDVLTAFKQYLNTVKIAGIVLNVHSRPADSIMVRAEVWVDPMVLSKEGTRLADGSKAVNDAVNAYLRGIVYGGTFNKTKLTDAIQAVEGVVDVELGQCFYKTQDSGAAWTLIEGNNYTAAGGSMVAEGLDNSLAYVVEN